MQEHFSLPISAAKELASQLSSWLEAAANDPSAPQPSGPAQGLIGPHAGYSYSGPTAAYAYLHMNPEIIDNVFVLGPSHAWGLSSCALPEADTYETPIATLKVNTKIISELRASKLFSNWPVARDEQEHSLEMHMPFIAQVMKGHQYEIVPILVGSLDKPKIERFGNLLAPYLSNPRNFFVISSDFCHWGNRFDYQPRGGSGPIHEYIQTLDAQGMQAIESQNLSTFLSYLNDTHNTICGRNPICVFMQALASSQRLWDVKFVKYAQSSKVVSMRDSSVSYASAIIAPKQ
eukprot:c8634_g1_i2.p1 GENE.c8634_g1_i2~~c8634_g1_i2.p1  ORF type:complete len:290 (-),score=63.32 c8634_g1_i2:157-1026(-)